MTNGGPAFPTTTTISDPFSGQQSSATINGMTLRDWFAGQAISGSMHRFVNLENDDQADAEALGIAADAYRLADAMIAERAK